MPFVSLNPATGRVIRRYRTHTLRQVEQRVAAAQRAHDTWRAVPLRRRASALRAMQRYLLAHRAELAALITTEMGKPVSEARAEIEKCASACAYYAKHGATHLTDESPEGAPAGAFISYQPLGVQLAIMPWNFPFWQAFRMLVPALLAGNTILLKHAPNVSGCAFAIETVIREAVETAHVLQALLVETATVPRLIKDPRVKSVALTGSTRAGRAVAAQAGAALKPCVLELGGSDAYLVLEDADLDHAARTLATARLINGGQSCIAAKRFIVLQSVRAGFEERLLAAFAARRQGNPEDLATDLGPMARADLRATVHQQVRQSVRRGARVLCGGRTPAGPGFFYPPTILTDVRPGMAVYDEEVFGPVAAIIPVRTEAEAIAVANATPYGLGGGVFTRDRRRGRRIATEHLHTGMAAVNDFVRSDPHLPFGGTKASGYGRELGRDGLRHATNIKTVTVS